MASLGLAERLRRLAACLALVAACRAGKGDGAQPIATTAQGSPRVSLSEPSSRTVPCFADAGTPAGASIELALVASRTRGVAPLAVFFDTAGTRAELAPRPFHELAFCWDFGDPNSESYAFTGNPKNRARGAVAGHVFERPGVYGVRVTARDRNGRTATRTIEIRVDDPSVVFAGEATTCFSARGDFTGCPTGAAHEKTSDLKAIEGHLAPGRRVLLGRGETFTGATVRLNSEGPGVIGSFGAGKPPRIVASATVFLVSDRKPRFTDWRIMDVFVEGRSHEVYVVSVDGKASDLLVLRVGATGIGAGVTAGDSIIDYWNSNGYPGNDVIDVLAVQDCDMQKLAQNGGVFAYIAAHRLLLAGNRFHDSTGGEHVLRTPWVDRGVISNNDLGEIPPEKHVLQIHAPSFNRAGIGRGRYTERVVFSENVFRGTGKLDWTLFIGPQNRESDERLRDLVFERNLFLPGGPQLKAGLVLAGTVTDVTVRDNVFLQAHAEMCVKLTDGGSTPALPSRILVAQNSCIGSGGPMLVEAINGVADLRAYNNLVVGPGARISSTDPSVGKKPDDAAGNLTLPPSELASAAPRSWQDARPRRESKAIDGARREHATFWDFAGQPRPLDGDGSGSAEPDVGALEAPAAAAKP